METAHEQTRIRIYVARLAAYNDGIPEVAELAAFIAEHGRLGAELLAHAGRMEAAQAMLDNDYAGEYRSLAEFAQGMTESGGDIPQHLRYYIDYERMARDMAIDSVFTITTGFEQTHVFWNR